MDHKYEQYLKECIKVLCGYWTRMPLEESLAQYVARVVDLRSYFVAPGRTYWDQEDKMGVRTRFVLWSTERVGSGYFDGFHGQVVFLGQTVIEPHTFNNQCGVTTIDLGAGIYKLLHKMCDGCLSLVSVRGPRVMIIERQAFEGCTSLHTAAFPHVHTIGEDAFINTALASADFPFLKTVPSKCFYGCFALKVAYLPAATEVKDMAFAGLPRGDKQKGCGLLTTLVCPNVETVGMRAFWGCVSLENIIMPKLKHAGLEAFYNNRKVHSVEMPRLLDSGVFSFSKCSSLPALHLPMLREAPDSIFRDCGMLEFVVLPNVKQISSTAFSGCVMLKVLKFSKTAQIENNDLFDVPSTLQHSLRDADDGSGFAPRASRRMPLTQKVLEVGHGSNPSKAFTIEE